MHKSRTTVQDRAHFQIDLPEICCIGLAGPLQINACPKCQERDPPECFPPATQVSNNQAIVMIAGLRKEKVSYADVFDAKILPRDPAKCRGGDISDR
jgi:hypothetical protein